MRGTKSHCHTATAATDCTRDSSHQVRINKRSESISAVAKAENRIKKVLCHPCRYKRETERDRERRGLIEALRSDRSSYCVQRIKSLDESIRVLSCIKWHARRHTFFFFGSFVDQGCILFFAYILRVSTHRSETLPSVRGTYVQRGALRLFSRRFGQQRFYAPSCVEQRSYTRT